MLSALSLGTIAGAAAVSLQLITGGCRTSGLCVRDLPVLSQVGTGELAQVTFVRCCRGYGSGCRPRDECPWRERGLPEQ